MRDRVVDQVVKTLNDTVDVQRAIELVRVGERLLTIAVSECIGRERIARPWLERPCTRPTR